MLLRLLRNNLEHKAKAYPSKKRKIKMSIDETKVIELAIMWAETHYMRKDLDSSERNLADAINQLLEHSGDDWLFK